MTNKNLTRARFYDEEWTSMASYPAMMCGCLSLTRPRPARGLQWIEVGGEKTDARLGQGADVEAEAEIARRVVPGLGAKGGCRNALEAWGDSWLRNHDPARRADVATVLHYAPRTYVMEQGSIALEGTSEELGSNDEVRWAYLEV